MRAYLDSQNVTLAAVLIYGIISVLVYFGLPLVSKLFGKPADISPKLLKLAAGLFFVSIFLPSPLIDGRNTNFVTHFIGGGVFSGLIWLYLKNNFKWRGHWLAELLSLYFLVSGLGVANELMEFTINGIGLAKTPGGDTWWDLFANTLGAFTFWLGYRMLKK